MSGPVSRRLVRQFYPGTDLDLGWYVECGIREARTKVKLGLRVRLPVFALLDRRLRRRRASPVCQLEITVIFLKFQDATSRKEGNSETASDGNCQSPYLTQWRYHMTISGLSGSEREPAGPQQSQRLKLGCRLLVVVYKGFLP